MLGLLKSVMTVNRTLLWPFHVFLVLWVFYTATFNINVLLVFVVFVWLRIHVYIRCIHYFCWYAFAICNSKFNVEKRITWKGRVHAPYWSHRYILCAFLIGVLTKDPFQEGITAWSFCQELRFLFVTNTTEQAHCLTSCSTAWFLRSLL